MQVEVELKLVLDVEEDTTEAVQEAFVQLLGDIGPRQMSVGVTRIGYPEGGL